MTRECASKQAGTVFIVGAGLFAFCWAFGWSRKEKEQTACHLELFCIRRVKGSKWVRCWPGDTSAKICMLSQDMYLCFELHARRCVCAAKDLRCVRCALAKQKAKIFARFTALADSTRQLLTLVSQSPHIALGGARNTDMHNWQGSPIVTTGERP